MMRQQRLAGVAHRLRVLALLGGQRRVEQQPGHADDAVHRRADLVAHRGQELALGAGPRLGSIARDFQLLRLVPQLDGLRGGLATGPFDLLEPELEGGLRLLPLGDIANHRAEQRPAADHHRADGQLDRDREALPRVAGGLEGGAVGRASGIGAERDVGGAAGDDLVDHQRQELRLGITEQPLRRGVDRLDAPGGIEGDEAIDHGPQHRGVTNPRLRQGIGRRDELAVHHRADERHPENDQHEEADEDGQQRRRGARLRHVMCGRVEVRGGHCGVVHTRNRDAHHRGTYHAAPQGQTVPVRHEPPVQRQHRQQIGHGDRQREHPRLVVHGRVDRERFHADVVHGADRDGQGEAAHLELPPGDRFPAHDPERHRAAEHRRDGRRQRDPEAIGRRGGEHEGQHADEVHRPDPGPEDAGSGPQPEPPRRSAPGHGDPVHHRPRCESGKNGNREGEDDERDVIPAVQQPREGLRGSEPPEIQPGEVRKHSGKSVGRVTRDRPLSHPRILVPGSRDRGTETINLPARPNPLLSLSLARLLDGADAGADVAVLVRIVAGGSEWAQ